MMRHQQTNNRQTTEPLPVLFSLFLCPAHDEPDLGPSLEILSGSRFETSLNLLGPNWLLES